MMYPSALVDQLSQPARKRVLVVPRLGDPLLMEGRARLIWAANSAEAWHRLGFEACLLGSAWGWSKQAIPFSVGDVEPRFETFYAVTAAIKILPVRAPTNWLTRSRPSTYRRFLRRLMPSFDLLHTRDFVLAQTAVKLGIPVIYEDHNEVQNRGIERCDVSLLRDSNFCLGVASTERLRDRLIRSGMPLSKTMVAHSGLNARSLEAVPAAELAEIRERYLGRSASKLLAYAGGLHSWRGLPFLWRLARQHPDFEILIVGGDAKLSGHMRRRATKEGLRNVHILGYRPQVEIPKYLQAADALLLPYCDQGEASVTSPLKFFEYLAAQRPIVAARLPELKPFANLDSLAIDWCEIGDYESFRAATEAAVSASGKIVAQRCQFHRQIARQYTWLRRQKAICEEAGVFLASSENARRFAPRASNLVEGSVYAWVTDEAAGLEQDASETAGYAG